MPWGLAGVRRVLVSTGKRFPAKAGLRAESLSFAAGTPAHTFEPACGWQAHQDASIAIRHHLQYLQGRWGFEGGIVRGRDRCAKELSAYR